MAYVSPAVQDSFENLPINLKNYILEKDVQINTVQDLIAILEGIVAEEDQPPS